MVKTLMIFVDGVNQLTQLYANSNDHDGSSGIINPPLALPINPHDIKSYSVYSDYAIVIHNNNSMLAVGNNIRDEIDEHLPKDKTKEIFKIICLKQNYFCIFLKIVGMKLNENLQFY